MNPQYLWEVWCVFFVIGTIGMILWGVWNFVQTNKLVDTAPDPVFISSAGKSQEMQRTLDVIDTVVQKRVGK